MMVYIYQPTKKFLRFVKSKGIPGTYELESKMGITNMRVHKKLLMEFLKKIPPNESIGLFVSRR